LVQQILSFTRGVEGRRACLPLSPLLTEVEQIIHSTLPKSILSQIQISEGLWNIYGDATQLHQVLVNLCVNARDAMPQGGILQIHSENVQIDAEAARRYLDAQPGDYVRITVSDTGTGIAPEIMHRIFDPFFTTKDIGKGSGLGLSAVLGIVKSHHGFIDVQSRLNQGSQFQIYLPAHHALATPQNESLESLQGAQQLVLVIDDEASIHQVITSTLETYNYRVLSATSGGDAIALYREQHDLIDAILLDLMMPTIDGLSLIPLLQQIRADVPVIAMSGFNATEVVAQLESLGVERFLPKPFTIDALLRSLQGIPCNVQGSAGL
jgi:two-component system, cell cycle sensor histidine kinase and response regulator CckA